MRAPSAGEGAVPALEARELGRTLGDKLENTVLHDIDLVVHRRELVALTGHSGSGKSTLLYLLGALDRPSRGLVRIDGVDLSALGDDARSALRNEKLGFVFQFHFLLPEFDATENVMIPLLRRGRREPAARARARDALTALGLGDRLRHRPGELSGGEQQRVAIARALANDPAVLLADEPTGNLDSRNGALVMDLFERLNRERGMTIVYVTHDADFAARAPRRVVLQDGALVADERRGPPPPLSPSRAGA